MTTTLDGGGVKGVAGKNDLCDNNEVPDSNLVNDSNSYPVY